jgi:hypothetical protein
MKWTKASRPQKLFKQPEKKLPFTYMSEKKIHEGIFMFVKQSERRRRKTEKGSSFLLLKIIFFHPTTERNRFLADLSVKPFRNQNNLKSEGRTKYFISSLNIKLNLLDRLKTVEYNY